MENQPFSTNNPIFDCENEIRNEWRGDLGNLFSYLKNASQERRIKIVEIRRGRLRFDLNSSPELELRFVQAQQLIAQRMNFGICLYGKR